MMKSCLLLFAILALTLVNCATLPEEDAIDVIKNEIMKEIKRNKIEQKDGTENQEEDADDATFDPASVESDAEEEASELPKKSPWGRRIFRRFRVRFRLRKAAGAVATCYRLGICG